MTRQDLTQAQADSGSLPTRPVGKESRLDGWTERVIDFFSLPGWLEAAVLLAAAGLYFYHTFNSHWPVGYAGLCTLMAEEFIVIRADDPILTSVTVKIGDWIQASTPVDDQVKDAA